LRFVDANVFIYHLASDPKFGKTAEEILRRIEDEEQAATSTLVISQVASYLKWKKKASVIPNFMDFLQSLPNLTKMETSFMDFVESRKIEHRAIGTAAWDDLVIASQMRRNKLDEIYSNDSDFDDIPGIRRLFK
jgi:predicted nucleic acid-binding protein